MEKGDRRSRRMRPYYGTATGFRNEWRKKLVPRSHSGPGKLPAIAQNGIESSNKFIHLHLRDHQRRQNFQRIQPMRSDLRQDAMA